jgi:hypothetical protein
MTRSFGRLYARKLRGTSRFVWTQDTLRIIVRGLFQFHRCGPNRVSLHTIAPHLRTLIRDHVKSVVCASHGNSNWADDHFERICARWIRLPSIGAVLLKLQEFNTYAWLVGSTSATYDSLRAEGFMTRSAYDVFDSEITRLHFFHHGCRLRVLPAIPRPCSQPSWGSCFYCGAGLTDKIDLNLLPKCDCIGELAQGEGDVCVCSSCVEDIADD